MICANCYDPYNKPDAIFCHNAESIHSKRQGAGVSGIIDSFWEFSRNKHVHSVKSLCGSLCLLCGSLCNFLFITQRTTEKTQRTTEAKLELLLFYSSFEKYK